MITNQPGKISDDAVEAIRPLTSLLAKSEKAVVKLTPGTWQHTMLQKNNKALRFALRLLGYKQYPRVNFSTSEASEVLAAFDEMIQRVAGTRTKFSPGTSQHTLQENRLRALNLAKRRITDSVDYIVTST